jgi:enolase
VRDQCHHGAQCGGVRASLLDAAPPPASTRPVELRDGDKKRYLGKGVLKAVENVNDVIAEASSASTRRTRRDRRRHDRAGRHAEQGSLGANAILASRWPRPRRRRACGLPLYRYLGGARAHVLPVPMMNILNGGKHADNNVDFQEFMVQPGARLRSARRCGWAPRSSTASRRC